MASPSHHVELALYAEDMANIATSHKLTLLVSYLDGLCVPRMEVRCSLPYPEVTGVTIQVSPPVARAHLYVSNGQIHEDLGVPRFADHIRSLTESFDSNLADVGNPLVRQLGRYSN